MAHEARGPFGPVSTLWCGTSCVLFAIGNTVYKADTIRDVDDAALPVGSLPDGCVVSSLVACGDSAALVGSADTLFRLDWSSAASSSALDCRRLACADGARFIKLAVDAVWQCALAMASNGAVFVVPLASGTHAASTVVTRVGVFEAGVLLAGDILIARHTMGHDTRARLSLFAATYAGTVVECVFAVPCAHSADGDAGQAPWHALVETLTTQQSQSGTLVAHRAGCAIFAVSSVAVGARGLDDGVSDSAFLATCSDDRTVAVFHSAQPDDHTAWTLLYRLQGTAFARCRVFDVCLAVQHSPDEHPNLFCGVAGEDGTVQAFQLSAQEPTPASVLYRPWQHDGHGVWKVGFVPPPAAACTDATPLAMPALVSAGFDGAVLRHSVGLADHTQSLALSTLPLVVGRKGKVQVRCVSITGHGLVACCTDEELLVYAHRSGTSQKTRTISPGADDVLRVPLHPAERHGVSALPTSITDVDLLDAAATNLPTLFVVGTDRGNCVLVTVRREQNRYTGTAHICTALAEQGKWLTTTHSAAAPACVVSCHLNGHTVLSSVLPVANGAAALYTLCPRFVCVSGPGRALSAVHLEPAAQGCWVLCGDRRGHLSGYALPPLTVPRLPATAAETASLSPVVLLEPSFSQSVFPAGQSVSAFSSAVKGVTVFAMDGLYTHVSLAELASTPSSTSVTLPSCPLRLPAKATAVLAASADALVAQHATTVSVYRRRPQRCTDSGTDWVQVAVYENVRAPRLLAAAIGAGTDAPVFFIHCSDGVTVETAGCGPTTSSRLRSDSQVLHGRAIAGKDLNACLFVAAPLNALLCAGEDTGLLVLPMSDGTSQPHGGPTTLYGPHHSNILALCELPQRSEGVAVRPDEQARHRIVTVGGLSTVVLWEWSAHANWRAVAVLTEEDAQDSGSVDRIPRFLSVRALGSNSFAVGSSDGTVRHYHVSSEGHCVTEAQTAVILNTTTPKPVLALGAVQPGSLCDRAETPSLVAGDTNGHVYTVNLSGVSSSSSSTHAPCRLLVERSAVNALSTAHAEARPQREPAASHVVRFVSLHDSGQAHLIRALVTRDGVVMQRVATIGTGITAGRGVCWPCPDGPVTLVSEEFLVCAHWRRADGQGVEAGHEALVVSAKRRSNVRCVSGLSVQPASTGTDGLIAVVGQGVEVIASASLR